ncbi:acetoacetate--CoA ligase [Tropicibacter naphthalenivorans]|uniref:Acetyl-coenzyme A synthetase n=1 Tax=Tropicibacter naphthalenivorans TaxID=441103 RepID=A0A0P1GGK5_9RHOB|nr:acetoacetate--CoA ligase [Tropicibacter naphthalenivorans]CUH80610.1 Acetyl-coenzyme A synthetase [Tropicibacter naphthalenivorans]SMC89036.1 acetoacetyl-CoA synthetase [Tropicibacter naphthalenivorans]
MAQVTEGQTLWHASPDRLAAANITSYLNWLSDRDQTFDGYWDLWDWSTQDIPGFWKSLWEYFDIIAEGDLQEVMASAPMPRTRWFTGTRLNYTEHVLRHERTGDPTRVMLHHSSELRESATSSWAEIGGAVRRLATRLREMGLGPGDRVVGYMPNIPETVVAHLAVIAIGATWSSAAPEFGAQTVIDRFSQISPKMVFAVNGYRYGGKDYDRTGDLTQIMGALPTAEHLVMLDYLPSAAKTPGPCAAVIQTWDAMLDGLDIPCEHFEYTRVASDHPLWVLFSSGTTGLPKPIVHTHHGIVLEHYKSAAFHFEIGEGGALFFYSTTGWMVWNTLMWGPLMNGRAVLYDGHPAYPDARLLWRIAEQAQATVLGVSPTYIQMVRQQGIEPGKEFDLSALQSVMLVGSPSTPETFQWAHEAIKPDIWASSQSGGTEFCSGILAGSPLLPTRAGEIQAPELGTLARAYDEACAAVIDAEGELVIERPMPSMPLMFWGDSAFRRYEDSYFATYPGVWHHGDRVKFNTHGGSFVRGRSDATLNRFGVRIGSAEIYRTMEAIPEVLDSLVVCIEEPGGGYYMPLFVQMAEGAELTDEFRKTIAARLRSERSPRHVPDEIIAAPGIPATLTGKKMEVPVRKLLMGAAPESVASRDATRNPDVLDWFADFAAKRHT